MKEINGLDEQGYPDFRHTDEGGSRLSTRELEKKVPSGEPRGKGDNGEPEPDPYLKKQSHRKNTLSFSWCRSERNFCPKRCPPGNHKESSRTYREGKLKKKCAMFKGTSRSSARRKESVAGQTDDQSKAKDSVLYLNDTEEKEQSPQKLKTGKAQPDQKEKGH